MNGGDPLNLFYLYSPERFIVLEGTETVTLGQFSANWTWDIPRIRRGNLVLVGATAMCRETVGAVEQSRDVDMSFSAKSPGKDWTILRTGSSKAFGDKFHFCDMKNAKWSGWVPLPQDSGYRATLQAFGYAATTNVFIFRASIILFDNSVNR